MLNDSSDSNQCKHWNTILHKSKDLAVSPFDFALGKPKVYTKIYPFLDTCSFRSRRHCSHLLDQHAVRQVNPDGYYPLPSSSSPESHTQYLFILLGSKKESKNVRGSRGEVVFGLSSPILPTRGVAKSSVLSEAEGLSLENTRDAQFCKYLW